MSKITLNNVGSLQDTTTAASTINGNFATIQTAFDNTLSRDGTAPDQMEDALDMNSNQIINLPDPATANSPLRLADLNSFIGGGTVTNLPPGGTVNEFLAKTSNADYAVGWEPVSVDLTAGSNIVLSGSTNTTVSTTPTPIFNTVQIGSNTVTSAPASGILVGTTDTQTLTNKTLVAPALGTPVSGILTNATGLPISTGVSGLGTGVSTFLITPSSANLAAAVTDETGSGSLVFGTAPTFITPTLGTPLSGTLTNCNGLTIAGIAGTPTGTGNLVLQTSPSLTTPNINVATATSINGSTISPGHYTGEPSSGNASAGQIGEYIESVIASGSAVGLTTAVAANMTSISLTAGDWDVDAVLQFTTASTTSVTRVSGGISLTTATVDTTNGRYSNSINQAASVVGVQTPAFTAIIPSLRFSISGTTTIFAVALCNFTVAALSTWGILRARRVR